MKNTVGGFELDGAAGEAEQTLRLLASLPAPDGLEERVRAGLRTAPRGGRVLAWPVTGAAGGWLRGAAAAAIVLVVAGGSWGVYSRVQQPWQPAKGIAGPRVAGPGEFSEGGAVRRPQTLQGPVVKAPAGKATEKTKQKPVAKAADKVKTNAPL